MPLSSGPQRHPSEQLTQTNKPKLIEKFRNYLGSLIKGETNQEELTRLKNEMEARHRAELTSMETRHRQELTAKEAELSEYKGANDEWEAHVNQLQVDHEQELTAKEAELSEYKEANDAWEAHGNELQLKLDNAEGLFHEWMNKGINPSDAMIKATENKLSELDVQQAMKDMLESVVRQLTEKFGEKLIGLNGVASELNRLYGEFSNNLNNISKLNGEYNSQTLSQSASSRILSKNVTEIEQWFNRIKPLFDGIISKLGSQSQSLDAISSRVTLPAANQIIPNLSDPFLTGLPETLSTSNETRVGKAPITDPSDLMDLEEVVYSSLDKVDAIAPLEEDTTKQPVPFDTRLARTNSSIPKVELHHTPPPLPLLDDLGDSDDSEFEELSLAEVLVLEEGVDNEDSFNPNKDDHISASDISRQRLVNLTASDRKATQPIVNPPTENKSDSYYRPNNVNFNNTRGHVQLPVHKPDYLRKDKSAEESKSSSAELTNGRGGKAHFPALKVGVSDKQGVILLPANKPSDNENPLPRFLQRPKKS